MLQSIGNCRLVVEHKSGFEQKPRSLYVVAKRLTTIMTIPLLIVEQSQMMGTAVLDSVEENVHQLLNGIAKPHILPHPIEVSVWFNDMKMSVHGLLLVGILIAQAHIGNFAPFAGERLQIAPIAAVAAVLLYIMKQADGIHESLGIACSTHQFAKTIDNKTYGINLLLGVERRAISIYRPIYASILLIVEMVDDISLGTVSHFKIFRALGHAVSRSKRP